MKARSYVLLAWVITVGALTYLFAVAWIIGQAYAIEETSTAGIEKEKPDKPDVVAEEFVKLKCPMKYIFEKMDRSDCLKCHTQNWTLIEVDPAAAYDPPYGTEIIWRDNEPICYNKVSSISPNQINAMFEWAQRHDEINKVIIEIHSPGGSLFDGWRYVGIIRSWWDRFEIETHLNGMAFSCGFLIFSAGEKRLVAPHSQGMWHEFWSFAMFDVKSPSKVADEAEEMKKIQRNVTDWLVSRSNVTAETIEEKTRKKNWWMNGNEMVDLGFADGFLWQDGE